MFLCFFFFWSESDLVIIDDMLHSMHFFRGLLNHSYLKDYYKEKKYWFFFLLQFKLNLIATILSIEDQSSSNFEQHFNSLKIFDTNLYNNVDDANKRSYCCWCFSSKCCSYNFSNWCCCGFFNVQNSSRIWTSITLLTLVMVVWF